MFFADDPFMQTLADARDEIGVLERNRAPMTTERVAQILDALQRAAEDYTRFLVESDARVWSGRSVEWLRGEFAELERQGHAFRRGGQRFYRAICLRRRVDLQAARDAGRRAV